MDRNEIALRLFADMLRNPDAKIDLYPELGEKQIRTCFHLADNFRRIAAETAPPFQITDLRGGQTAAEYEPVAERPGHARRLTREDVTPSESIPRPTPDRKITEIRETNLQD